MHEIGSKCTAIAVYNRLNWNRLIWNRTPHLQQNDERWACIQVTMTPSPMRRSTVQCIQLLRIPICALTSFQERSSPTMSFPSTQRNAGSSPNYKVNIQWFWF